MNTGFRAVAGSIATKIGLALALMGMTTIAAIAIGLMFFQTFSDRLGHFNSVLLPAMKDSAQVIEKVGVVRDQLSDVFLARDRAQLDAALAGVAEAQGALANAVGRLPDDMRAEIAPVLPDLDAALGQMARDLSVRLEAEESLAGLVATFEGLSAELGTELEQLANGAFFNLVLGGKDTISQVSGTLERLIESDFERMTAVLGMRAEINLLTGIGLAAANSRDEALRSILRDLAATSLRGLNERLDAHAEDPLLTDYMPALQATRDYFAQTLDTGFDYGIAARDRILDLRQTSDTALAMAIDDVTFTLILEGESAGKANAAAIQTLLDREVGQLRAAATLNTAIRSLFAAAMLGAATQTPEAADAAQQVVDLQASAVPEALRMSDAAARRFEDLPDLVAEFANPEAGIVGARRAALLAQGQAMTSSDAASSTLAAIAERTQGFAGGARREMVAAGEDLMARADSAQTAMALVGALGGAIFLAALVLTWALILRPIRRLTAVTRRLSEGDLSPVDGFRRAGGEIGQMARSLTVFRDGMIERQEMQKQEELRVKAAREAERAAEREERRREERRLEEERRAEAERLEREAEEARRIEALRAETEAERAAHLREQDAMVRRLATALDSLAAGDLTVTIDEAFPGAYEELRQNFNSAVSTLGRTIISLAASADVVNTSSSDLARAARDLASRTEVSAATLEETTAAVTDLASAATASSQRAGVASAAMQKARASAESSDSVVRRAIETMSEIEGSSTAISNIVDLIESIAFQTNLLALNAGVEAARAGENGKGFAVVATEVRALSQRSSEAARDINDLISTTRGQIERGVSQVGEAGAALSEIIQLVSAVARDVDEISQAARQQSSTTTEISTAIQSLDQTTQKNAAMFQDTAATSQSLNAEARRLSELAATFNTRQEPSAGRNVGAARVA